MAVVEMERSGSAEPEVEQVTQSEPGRMPTERLEAEVRSLATQIAAATCRWLLMVAELDRREAYAQWECRSMAAWLSWHCSMSLRTANEHVRVARALESLPTTTAMFSRGELSYSKVRALTRVADPMSEADLAEAARSLTAAMLDETCGSVARIHREVELGRDTAQQARRGVHFDEHVDGTVTITARVTPTSPSSRPPCSTRWSTSYPTTSRVPPSPPAGLTPWSSCSSTSRPVPGPATPAPRSGYRRSAPRSSSTPTWRPWSNASPAGATRRADEDSRSRPCVAWRATAGCASASNETAVRSTSADGPGAPRPRCDARAWRATVTGARSPAATRRGTCSCTTSGHGSTVARPMPGTSCRSVTSTIGRCTNAVGGSPCVRTAR
jgi:hypothetical protein